MASNPSQITGWQGLTKLYENVLEASKNNANFADSDRKWGLNDVVNAYRKILSICEETLDIDKFVGVSIKLVQLHQTRLHKLDDALEVLKDRILFLEKQNESTKIKEAYVEMVQIISAEAQVTEVSSDERSILLCEALEKVLYMSRMSKIFIV